MHKTKAIANAVLNKVIDFVWDHYGQYSGLQLSHMTHAEGSPWDLTRKENLGIKDADIPRKYLSEHFSKYVNKEAGNQA